MDSPSLDTPPLPSVSDRQSEAGDARPASGRPGRPTREDVVLIAGFGDAVAVDFASFVRQGAPSTAVVVAAATEIGSQGGPVDSLILFLSAPLTEHQRRELGAIVSAAGRWQTRFVGIVSSFRVHLDDPAASAVENHVLALTSHLPARVVVFRPGHVLSRHSRMSRLLTRFAPCYPLVPERQRSCFLEGTELFAAIEAQRLAGTRPAVPDRTPGRAVAIRNRAYTLLGPNRPWRDTLMAHRVPSPGALLTTAFCMLLSWFLPGHLIALVLNLAARRVPELRQWNVHTLFPRSIRELLSLCHQGNADHVKVVGYNNGVVHFGHRYPQRTIVSTIRCHRLSLAHAGPKTLKADCGATVRKALDFLAARGQELYVVPNYSYVSLGTAFFVPIHGSAVDFSTVADTIQRVVLYDPESDRIIAAARDDAAFIENVYDPDSRVVVLRLYLLAKPKSRYFVHHETWQTPSAGALLDALRDRGATNVEIRQAHAASAKVTVSRYFKELGDTSAPALELPRDALGRLWDRLEENPLTSFLMHAVGRHVVWHTELFLTAEEFTLFWETHGQLPLRKLQLRYIRRDGLAHSPFRDQDCVSIDLFVFRRHRVRFQEYLQQTLPAARTNPGKHSH